MTLVLSRDCYWYRPYGGAPWRPIAPVKSLARTLAPAGRDPGPRARACGARRGAGGSRVRAPLVVAMFMPWALGAAVVETVLLAPFALLAAAAVVAAARIAMGREPLALATATAAVAYTAVSCLGPRSRSPRRGLNRFLNAIAPTP